MTLYEFRGYELTEKTPDHSTQSVIRNRIGVETHEDVFGWILDRLDEHGLIKGKTIGGVQDRNADTAGSGAVRSQAQWV